MESKQNNLKAKSIVYQSKRSRLSQVQVNELLNAKLTMDQDYFVEDEQHWEDQNGQINLKEEINSTNKTFTKRCVGRIVSKFPKKQRISKDNHKTDKEIVISGTASYIGQNLLLTAAHNIFLWNYNQMASEVYFIPEICNNQDNPQSWIPALKYAVFDEYVQNQKQYSGIYDIALVQLQDNKFEKQTRWFEIQWSYKRRNQTNKNLNHLGYPTSKRNNSNKTYSIVQQQKYIFKQNQFICYRDTQSGQSGGPLLKIIDKQKQESVKIVGLHKGVKGLMSLGLTLNTNQNTQQILFQLAQQLQVEEKLDSYEISHKKLRELTRQDNIVKKQKQVNVLKKKNKQLEKQVEKLKCKINQLQAKIEQLQIINKNQACSFKQMKQDKIDQSENDNLEQKFKKISQKLHLELYSHFQSRLPSNRWHYNKKSNYYLIKQLEKEDIQRQVNRFLNNFNILEQSQSHHEQLLCLIEIYNRNHFELITNRYHISNVDGPRKCQLVLTSDQPFDLNKFVTFNNWHHLGRLSLTCGKWFDCDSWRMLVKHASNFKYLKKLELKSTNIKQINEGDIQTFEFLQEIRFWTSPLSKETKQLLQRLEETSNIMIDFDR